MTASEPLSPNENRSHDSGTSLPTAGARRKTGPWRSIGPAPILGDGPPADPQPEPALTSPVATSPRRWPHHVAVVALCFAAVIISYIDRTNISVAAIAMKDQFGWTETIKGFVLSSFFIGYILLQVVSGTLANRFGGRIVLGVAVVWWSAFTVLTPPAAFLSLPALVATRIGLGLGEAAMFPAAINMVGRWVPAASRTRAVAAFTSGLSFGTMISLPLTGWLIRAYGWPLPFYAFGLAGIIWAVVWFVRVPEGRSPAVEAERPAVARTIPWGRLLSTPAVWAIVVNHFCTNWTLYLLVAWLPSYFKTTFGLSLANAGLYSAAPWAVSFFTGNGGAAIAERLLRRGANPTTVRKTMQIGGLLGSATCLLLLQLVGSAEVAVVLMCGATAAFSLTLAGFAPNSFDIAPRYADVIWGMSNTVATLPGIVGVAVTGWLVQQTGSYTAPFLLTAGVSTLGAMVYLLFASGNQLID